MPVGPTRSGTALTCGPHWICCKVRLILRPGEGGECPRNIGESTKLKSRVLVGHLSEPAPPGKRSNFSAAGGSPAGSDRAS